MVEQICSDWDPVQQAAGDYDDDNDMRLMIWDQSNLSEFGGMEWWRSQGDVLVWNLPPSICSPQPEFKCITWQNLQLSKRAISNGWRLMVMKMIKGWWRMMILCAGIFSPTCWWKWSEDDGDHQKMILCAGNFSATCSSFCLRAPCCQAHTLCPPFTPSGFRKITSWRQ